MNSETDAPSGAKPVENSTEISAGPPTRVKAWRRLRGDLLADVLGERASVGALAGWLLSALFGLVIWLTSRFAANIEADGPGAAISVRAGYLTIAVVAALALAAALQPRLQRLADVLAPPGLGARRGALGLLGAALTRFYRLPGRFWSLIDYLLARPMASLAGMSFSGAAARYGVGGGTLAAVLGLGLYAPPTIALAAIVYGLVALVAVVRRWGWVERDRTLFVMERGAKPGAMRVGHQRDMRDEALIGLMALFALIPLGLMQVDHVTCAAGDCAFRLASDAPDLPDGRFARFLVWLGFFGAELAKSAPFVDWSEVYHVTNGSPLEARSALGAALVFLLRASLDLLLLAAVTQAVQIAGRLRDQLAAFREGRLDILEPFQERREFLRIWNGFRPELDLRAVEQPSLDLAPAYDSRRLREILTEGSGDADPREERQVRMVAAALLQGRHRGEPTERFLTERAAAEPDPALRRWLECVASHLSITRALSQDQPLGAVLTELLEDDDADPRLRAAAARGLGRSALRGESAARLLDVLTDQDEEPALRVDAGVALAKAGIDAARRPLETLASGLRDAEPGEARITVMAAAYGLAALEAADTQEARTAIADRFATPLRPAALLAARLQRAPSGVGEAGAADGAGDWRQLIRLTPGQGLCPARFDMGSSADPAHPQYDPNGFASERPLRSAVALRHPFAIGRYPVTQEEYLWFCQAAGHGPIPAQDGRIFGEGAESRRWPAMLLDWWDANAFCDWLTRVTGDRHGLPSEAQWEYACRAGTVTRYSWGDAFDPDRAASSASELPAPPAVDRYEPNDWGLYAMHGTVAEWCADPWRPGYGGAPPDDRAWTEGADMSMAAMRGGSRSTRPRNLRSAVRGWDKRTARSYGIGFRVCRFEGEAEGVALET